MQTQAPTQQPQDNSNKDEPQADVAAELVAAYRAARPFLFPHK